MMRKRYRWWSVGVTLGYLGLTACARNEDTSVSPGAGEGPSASGGVATAGAAPAGAASGGAASGTSGGVAQAGASAGGAAGGGPSSSGGNAGQAPSAGSASGGSAQAGSAGSASGGSAQAGSAGSASGGSAQAGSAGASNGGQGGSPPTTGTPDPNNGADGALTPIGFAAQPGMGLDTTTGGGKTAPITVTTFEELSTALDSEATQVIVVQGTIDLQGGMVPMRSNKTLIGLKGARLDNGGIEMNKRQNIIVRNIIFSNGTDDTFKINQNTHHVWVDHCDFTKAEDGLFDITRQSSFITISWNKFYEHSKTMLIGHSDAETGDVGFLKTTIHHNFFNGTEQRHPRVRFGEVHVFNNYFLANNLYGVASTMDAKVVVEGNYFENVPHPTHSGYQDSGPGDIVERNNAYVGSGAPETRGSAFDPKAAYPYVVENPTTLPELLRSKAGAGVIDPMTFLPK
jgi:pectate lyase